MKLRNLGQTCYANSLMQCLLNSPSVCNFLETFHKTAESLLLDKKMLELPLFQFVDLYRKKSAIKSGTEKLIIPEDFVKSYTHLLPQFVIGRQHDAHELFVCLLSAFDETIEELNSKHSVELPTFSSLFACHSVTQCQCLMCGYKFTNAEDFNNFYISVKQRESLVARLRNAQAPEFLCGEGKRWCNKCRIRQEMMTVCRYDKLSKIAVFQLQRFEVDIARNTTKKLLGHVPFPSVLPINGLDYELMSVSVHIGANLTSGHFVSILRINERWILANDSHLSVLNNDEVEEFFSAGENGYESSTSAYLLFYELMK